MAAVDVGPVAVVGLGAVGGSVAKALVGAGASVRGFTPSPIDAEAARGAGIEAVPTIDACVAGMPMVLIAVPLTAHIGVAETVIARTPKDAVLLHAASLQGAKATGRLGPVIGTHPLAGTQGSGFAAASADMFAGCTVSVEVRASDDVRAAAEALWRAVGARRFEYRSAEEHDRLMTWISHLPQLASTALANAIASAGVGSGALGSGGRDATRLAQSSWEMWRGILDAARPEAAGAAAALERSVGAIRSALESGDMRAVERMWTSAQAWAQPR